MHTVVTTSANEADAPPVRRAQPGVVRGSSAILDRIGADVSSVVAGQHSGSPVRVEAVTPRRIGSFRVELAAPAACALEAAPWVGSCVPVPPNLYLDLTPERLTELVHEELTPERCLGYRANSEFKGRTVNLAFCSPNANKPLHLGHGRNMVLGAAIANLLEVGGAHVLRSCCISDYGVHIAKAVAAYLRWGDHSTPASTGEKPDHFVGRFYAAYAADPALAHGPISAPALVREWLRGSEEVRELTRRVAGWAETGFDQTFEEWRIRFDHRFHETEEQAYIDQFLARQVQEGKVHRDGEGRLVVPAGQDRAVVPLTRSDSSPLYMSHMVAAILQRLDQFGPGVEVLMALTADEQRVPFRQLASVLAAFGYGEHVEIRHLTHGLVRARGRSLSSRDGTDLTLDQVVDEIARSVGGVASTSARVRGRAVLALHLLARSSDKPLDYSQAECVRAGNRLFLDIGNTLRLSRPQPVAEPQRSDSTARSDRWLVKLAGYPVVLGRAVSRLDPSLLLTYLGDLCHDFVGLRRSGQVADALLTPTRDVVGHALEILNLPVETYFPDIERVPVSTTGRPR